MQKNLYKIIIFRVKRNYHYFKNYYAHELNRDNNKDLFSNKSPSKKQTCKIGAKFNASI